MSRGCTRGRSRWDWGLGLGAWIRGPWDWYLNLRAPLPGRRKKLRFHPRQLYLSVKQGELQKVILMLCECRPRSFSRPYLRAACVPVPGLGARRAAARDTVFALKDEAGRGRRHTGRP